MRDTANVMPSRITYNYTCSLSAFFIYFVTSLRQYKQNRHYWYTVSTPASLCLHMCRCA